MDLPVYVLNEQNIHRPILPGELPADALGNVPFINGSSPYLQLVEGINVSPENGDIWFFDDEVWVMVGDVIRSFCELYWAPALDQSSLSSMAPVVEDLSGMTAKHLLVEDQGRHRKVRLGDEVINGTESSLFFNGTTKVLKLPEYHNLTPTNGQIWRYQGYLWSFMEGQLYVLQECPGPMLSSLSSSSSSMESSSSSMESSLSSDSSEHPSSLSSESSEHPSSLSSESSSSSSSSA